MLTNLVGLEALWVETWEAPLEVQVPQKWPKTNKQKNAQKRHDLGNLGISVSYKQNILERYMYVYVYTWHDYKKKKNNTRWWHDPEMLWTSLNQLDPSAHPDQLRLSSIIISPCWRRAMPSWPGILRSSEDVWEKNDVHSLNRKIPHQ